MYLAHITLLSVLCVISEQTTFDKSYQSINNITLHPIPGGTTLVKFNNNAIADIADSAFSQVPTVTNIFLYRNQLTVIRQMMFSGLPNLLDLRLYRNQIHTIEFGSFKGNTALKVLSLGYNSLETVSQCMFDPTNHPASLKIYMKNNPLQCDQDLCWLKQVDTTWITVNQPSDTTCAGPAALNGRKWNNLTEHDLCDTSG